MAEAAAWRARLDEFFFTSAEAIAHVIHRHPPGLAGASLTLRARVRVQLRRGEEAEHPFSAVEHALRDKARPGPMSCLLRIGRTTA